MRSPEKLAQDIVNEAVRCANEKVKYINSLQKPINMLTGKCKKDFELWYIENDNTFCLGFWKDNRSELLDKYDFLYDLPFNMQYSVYLEFFDSVGIVCDVQPVLDYNDKSYIKVKYFIATVNKLNDENIDYNGVEREKRQEAQKQAILKANEIYNT